MSHCLPTNRRPAIRPGSGLARRFWPAGNLIGCWVGYGLRCSLGFSLGCFFLLLLPGGAACATDINLVGLFPGKAVLVIDRGTPRTFAIGEENGGVRLLSTGTDSALLQVDGKRQTVVLGQFYGSSSQTGRSSTTLTADGRGHYITQGAINGNSMMFMVDTGATLVVLSSVDAVRLGIDYHQGRMQVSNTANGPVIFYQVTLNSIKIGDIVINNVAAGVQENGLGAGQALLGMSFLSRTEMTRDGQAMVLTKRF